MRTVVLLLFLSPIALAAQYYTNASDNLPDAAAMRQSMDVQAADLDQDGDLDIVLANEFQPNTILRNEGNGQFVNGTPGNMPQTIHDSEDVTIADFNGDGYLDLVFCSEDDVNLGAVTVHEYYLGNGDGSFLNTSNPLPDSEANAVITAELNGDEFPDLLFGNKGPTGVLINNGDGTFTPDTERVPQITRTTQDLAMVDVDGDGDLDLFEGNETGNLLHINDGTGHFTNETLERLPQDLFIETRKVTFGDVDGDNDQDIFLSNVGFIPGKDPRNRLFINDGNGYFTDGTLAQLPFDNDHTIDGIFEDVDLDGDLDLVVANVFGAPMKIYLNDGAGNFTVGTSVVLGQDYLRDALGIIAADLNGDGYRDLYICDRKTPQTNNKDLLLLREPITATEENALDHNSTMTIFPNPVKSYFYVQTNLTEVDSIQLLDIGGREVANLRPQIKGADLYFCEVGKLPAGVYLVTIGQVQKQIIVPG